jgi:hypothetical protein
MLRTFIASILGSTLLASVASAQQLQFCIYNKYGQRAGGCYVDSSSCQNVAASYNKSNGSMGHFCQPEKK